MSHHHHHRQHVRPRYPEVEENYELFETLGSGGFAKVKLGKHKLTGEKVAVKIMNKIQLGDDLPRVYREMRALKNLHHQHVCQLFEVIETDLMIYMILEYCSGGELFDYIVAKEKLKEPEARTFFRQIVAALKYVHTSGFIHRDLKPENLLLDEYSNIKLIDFGLVAEPKDIRHLLKTCCGSPAYAAPELIKGGPYIGPRADVWSLGVLLYALLNGFLPFDDDNTAELYRLIQNGRYDKPRWLSRDSLEILDVLLQTIPERRVTVDELLNHPWVMQGYSRPIVWDSKIDINELDTDCIEELSRYHGVSTTAMTERVLRWDYDHLTATYFLLFRQKLAGKEPKIKAPPKKVVTRAPSLNEKGPSSPLTSHRPYLNKPSSLAYDKTKNEKEDDNSISDDDKEEDSESESDEDKPIVTKDIEVKVQPPSNTSITSSPRTRKISLGQPMHPPTLGEIVSLRRPAESPKIGRPVYPAINHILANEGSFPVQVKQKEPKTLTLPPILSPPGSIAPSASFQGGIPGYAPFLTPQLQPKVVKTMSYDSRLNKAGGDSSEELSLPPLPHSPKSRRRFGSVDFVLTKLRKAVRRPSSGGENGDLGPRTVKGLFDANTTSCKSESEVMQEIERVLNDMNIPFTKKNNYTYICKLEPQMKRGSKKPLTFSLEVCLIGNLSMMGIKRKRIGGDVWRYKEICKQILDSTHL
ncbi:PREDICTED: maternal embryonic leucine zipper kinase-like [Amphimedon queenslandica]|uniref:Maternal embryonic leucine zipper kinase n=1 Tax=Amphimedon queenslandica TaxID=400682 RepID=A0A1X7TW33_AMPQE|nr:PREDICTED: maternal embryonic leucine zipper kinase-like [Amphimedon queenslandica]|eukprot:XP_019857367.1 PREDICTED: maternal embryonic leucine zipper kinase-like [Amphimedon queenslandica]